MASSYTSNSGIEKPAEGDQTGEWGDTVNTNMDIIDRSINGVGAITLSGTTHTLTTTDGTLSDGMYKVLVLGGSPSGTNTITISPNDQDKVYIVVNGSGQTATFTQGSGGNVSVLNGDSKIIYADGAGSGAAVVDITANLSFSSVNIDGGTIDGTVIGGASAAAGTFTTVTASGEIDGASLDISGNADIDGTLETDALSIASTTVTSTAAELNYNDTGAAVGTVVASKTVTVDANKDVASFRNITLTGELDAGSLDISGNADIDGTLEADAMTLNGVSITATATLSTGISNTNVPVFTTGVADDDFLRVAGTSIEGRSAAEVLSDIGGQASLTFGISNTNAVKIDSASVADDEYARFTANGLESRSTSEVLSDIGGQASLTFGISNTNAVKIDSASVADDEYARFTANGLESRSTAEVLSDIGASAVAGSSSIVTTGALNSGSITSGFGTINNGSSAITTTGLISGGSLDIDDVVINGSTIGHTDDTDLITVANGVATVAGEVSMTTLDIGGTNVTSTAAELNLVDGSSAGSVVNSKAVIYSSGGVVNATDVAVSGSGNRSVQITSTDGIGFMEIGSAADNISLIDLKTPSSDDYDVRLQSQAAGAGGSLLIAGGTFLIGGSGESMATFADDGAVTLYYDNVAKLATASGGVAITGDATFADSGKALFGAGSDLQIYHDGSNSYIDENGDGQLNIRTVNGASINLVSGSEFMVQSESDGAVTLYHNGTAKLATTSTGASITTSADTSSALSISRASGGGVVTIESYNAIGGIGTTDNIPFRFNTNNTERVRILNDGKVGIGTTAPTRTLTVIGSVGNQFVGSQSQSNDTAKYGTYAGNHYHTAEEDVAGLVVHSNGSDNIVYLGGGVSELNAATTLAFHTGANDATTGGTERMKIGSDGNVIVKKTAAGGVTIGADSDTSNTSDTFLTLEGTSETHGSAVIQKGLAGNTTFYQNVVYHTDCTSAEEVSRITGSGTNGFMMLIRVHTCGHTAAVGDGFDIKYYTWSGASSTPTQVYSLGGGGNNPDITVSVPSANVLVVNVASADATNTYRGAVQIEYLVPNDFGNSTWVVS